MREKQQISPKVIKAGKSLAMEKCERRQEMSRNESFELKRGHGCAIIRRTVSPANSLYCSFGAFLAFWIVGNSTTAAGKNASQRSKLETVKSSQDFCFFPSRGYLFAINITQHCYLCTKHLPANQRPKLLRSLTSVPKLKLQPINWEFPALRERGAYVQRRRWRCRRFCW